MFPYKRTIMVFPARMGDTIRYTPAVRFLKKNRPDIEIGAIFLSKLSASVFKGNPNLDRIYLLPGKREIKKIAQYYDVGINIHDSQEARKYFKLLRVKVINKPAFNPNKHAAQEGLEFVQSLLGFNMTTDKLNYELFPQPRHYSKMRDLLLTKGASLGKEILVGCHLGCHSTAKRGFKFWKDLKNERFWPLENFIEVESEIRKYDPRVRFVLTGSSGERFLGKAFKEKSNSAINLVGYTSVLELAALMDYLKVYITSDTGPLHVACATNVKLISLFLPKYLSRSSPFPKSPNRVVISKPTMEEISATEVLNSVVKLIK